MDEIKVTEEKKDFLEEANDLLSDNGVFKGTVIATCWIVVVWLCSHW